jgi:hypothetical protein
MLFIEGSSNLIPSTSRDLMFDTTHPNRRLNQMKRQNGKIEQKRIGE